MWIKERAWIVGDVVRWELRDVKKTVEHQRIDNWRILDAIELTARRFWAGDISRLYEIGVTLPITLPLDKFRWDITPKRKTSAAVPEAMGGIVSRN